MASLLKNIAEPCNKDKVYNTKDMVLYNNLLYLCIYNNVSGEFDSSKWIEVQLTDLVQGKLRGIEDYSGRVIDASYIEQDDDYTYFGVPQKAFVDNETSFRTLNSNLASIKSGEINIVNGNSFSLNIGKNKHYIIIHKKGAPAISPLNYLFFLDNDYLIRTWEDGSTAIYSGVTVNYVNGVATFSSNLVSTYFGAQSDMCWSA